MNKRKKMFAASPLLDARCLPRWLVMICILPLLAMTNFCLAQPMGKDGASFNHLQTGFNLVGPHTTAPCESCHVQGIFKGTPRDCASCHTLGNRMGATAKPNRHIPTTVACDKCHRPTTWVPANYSHVGVAPGTCLTCHNNLTATGKPNGHILTKASCDTCHRTIAWIPAGYDHTGVAPGSCANCHGVNATGKPNGHVATSAACDTCHNTRAWLPAGFNHRGVAAGSCATCHNGTSATGKPNGHVATTDSCDKCHNTTTWLGAGFNHVGVASGSCASCHNGTTAKGVGGSPTTQYPAFSGHVPTGRWPSCDICHKSTSTFLNARVHGSGASVSGLCNICHRAHNDSQSCDHCHSTSTWNN